MTRKVPAWTLALAVLAALVGFAFAWVQADEVQYLKAAIRSREASVPGFLEHTSPLSDEAYCRRSILIRLKDRLIGTDSCTESF